MFISEAFAQTAETVAGGNDATRLVVQIVLILAVFYFLLFRPQKKKYEEHERTLRGISRGDKIVVGGIVGTVSKTIGENELIVEIAENVKIKVLRNRVIGLYEEENNNESSSDDKKGSSEKLKKILNDKK